MTKGWTTGVWILAACMAVGLLILFLSPAVSVEAVYPFERAHSVFVRRVATRFGGLLRGAAARSENARLRREIAALVLSRGDAERLELENARLRRALGYVEKAHGHWLAAAVLSKRGGAAGFRDTLRVDKGSLDGVAEGAVVTVPEGLVGRVATVTPHTSEVMLLTDPTLKVACEIELDGGVRPRGILEGGGEELLVLRHMTGAAQIPSRSRVITSGLGGVFPRGLEVGSFVEARVDSRGLAREGDVQPSVDWRSLEDVFIRCEK